MISNRSKKTKTRFILNMANTSIFEKTAKFFTVFCMGFFGLLAQTLLFRTFLIVFGGNELSIGLFFFSWLIWVCIGAWIAKRRIISKLSKFFYLFIILYLPLYVIQLYLFFNAQTLLGRGSFEQISFNLLIPFVLLCNAPISFLTGLLFVLGTDWVKKSSVPVIKIYICESLGSFFGALIVTLLLFTGCIEESIFLIAAFVILLSTFPHIFIQSGLVNRLCRIAIPILLLIILSMLFTGYSEKWNNYNNRIEWQNFLQQGRYKGSFSTPQAKYLYGTYKDDFIVSAWNSTYEALPNTESSSKIVGEYLSQNPKAERIMVIGPGSYSICRSFSKLSQIKKIVWLDTDPDYPKNLLKIIPAEYRTNILKIKTSKYDVKKYIEINNSKFDLIVLNLPNPSTLLLNRYFTFEFFEQIKKVTAPSGIVGVNFPAGANYMGTELSFMGSSLLYTLRQVYDYIILKPGGESCFFAARNKDIVSNSGVTLQKRLNSIKDIRKVFYPQNIKSIFETSRITFQMKKYENIINKYPPQILLNTDKNPKSFLYTLLFTIKKLGNVGFSLSDLNRTLLIVFPWIILIAFMYFVLRIFYYYYYGVKKSRRKKINIDLSKTEQYFGVFVAAITGLSINLILIFLFQIYFGSIFLYFGIITALFMLGLFISGLTVEKLIRFFPKNRYNLTFISVIYIIYILLIYFNPPGASQAYFATLFLCAGLFSGPYFAIAALSLKKQNVTNIQSGSKLEIIDNLGGAIGSILCSIILLPIIGINKTLIIMLILLGIILLHSLFLKGRMHRRTNKLVIYVRTIGFFMLGIALFFIIASALTKNKEMSLKPTATWTLTTQQKQELSVNNRELVQKDGEVNGTSFTYYAVKEGKVVVGYIFKTKDFSKENIQGHAGPIHMLSYVSPDGEIQNFTILESNETPGFLDKVLESKNIYFGQKVFNNQKNYQVNAITGATESSTAISKTLLDAGRNFSAINLNKSEPTKIDKPNDIYIYLPLLALILFTVTAIILRYLNNRSYRYCFLIVVIAVLGICFNIQYSMDQVFALISFNLYLSYVNTSLFLCIAIPILIMLFGNIYCGYLCPFGALQELLHSIVHFIFKKLGIVKDKAKLSKSAWGFSRLIKYIILFFLVILFISLENNSIAENTDILPYIFNYIYPSKMTLYFIIAFLIISLFYKRFWCRVLCPVGAFLSLFNAIRLTRKMKHQVQIENCDLGVYSRRDIDCICCDNCRNTKTADKIDSSRPKSKIYNNLFIILSVICFCYIVLLMYQGYGRKRKTASAYELKPLSQVQTTEKTKKPTKPISFSKKVLSIKSIGTARNIDIQKYKDDIKNGNLSDREAMYYKKIK